MKNSSGNILFLILIAVALFATLGYAVIQSTRSGGGDASKETNTVNAASLSQYTASLRAAVQRMVVSGVAVTDLEFNPPSDFANCTSPSVCVFHPDGGGVIYQTMPMNLINNSGVNSGGAWNFTLNVEVQNVGNTSYWDIQTSELIAFIVGIKEDLCKKINQKLGLPFDPLPNIQDNTLGKNIATASSLYYMDNDYIHDYRGAIGNDGPGDIALIGKHEGCYLENEDNSKYVYYSVLIAQ